MIRLKSSAVTGGVGNPVVATAEAGSSITLSLIAIFIPAVAVMIVGIMIVYLSFMIKKNSFHHLKKIKNFIFAGLQFFNIPIANRISY